MERMLFEHIRKSTNNAVNHCDDTAGDTRLTLEQKCLIATSQLDLLQQQAQQAEKEHNRVMDTLHAQASSLRDVIAHVQQDVDDLQRSTSPATRWLDERCKHASAATTKLNNAHRALKVQVGVLTQQLAAVQHESVKEIDLEQLRIENALYREQLRQAAHKAADARRAVSAAIEVGRC